MEKKKKNPVKEIINWSILGCFFVGFILIVHSPVSGEDWIWYVIAGLILLGIAGGYYLLLKKKIV